MWGSLGLNSSRLREGLKKYGRAGIVTYLGLSTMVTSGWLHLFVAWLVGSWWVVVWVCGCREAGWLCVLSCRVIVCRMVCVSCASNSSVFQAVWKAWKVW